MQHPWLKHPKIRRGSIGRRMGMGEDTYNRFYIWFSSLSDEQVADFSNENPEPDEWISFYNMIRSKPWIPND
jgi:hypothetical protein